MRPGLTEKSFRLYEPHLLRIQKSWPNLVSFDLSNSTLSRATFLARIRDAKASFLEFKWTSELAVDKMEKVSFVEAGTDRVLGGPDLQQTLKKAKESIPAETAIVRTNNQTADLSDTMLDPTTLAYLASKRLLTQPIQVALSEKQVTLLETNFDVSLEKCENGTYILT